MKLAGFKIDSSYPTFSAFRKINLKYDFYEIPFLRLPDFGSMDLEFKNYSDIKKQILKNIESGKILVVGFHLQKQSQYFDDFKELIGEILQKEVKFLRLKDIIEVIR